jgi:hypothetical protein
MDVGTHETDLIRNYNDRNVFGLVLSPFDSVLNDVT